MMVVGGGGWLGLGGLLISALLGLQEARKVNHEEGRWHVCVPVDFYIWSQCATAISLLVRSLEEVHVSFPCIMNFPLPSRS